MSKHTLFDKVWDIHKVARLDSGFDQLFIGLHLIHEVTSPQAFQMLHERGLPVLYPDRTFATVDHIVPTDTINRPFSDTLAEKMLQELEINTKKHGIAFFNLQSGKQGIVHVIGPELGLTQPGMTIACGDSHTSTHGAFGSIGLGIGTTQIRDVFATQCISLEKPKVRKFDIYGHLSKNVYAKDIILTIIARLGVMGGLGYAYEYNGTAIHALNMEERMTICNMSIEGGARVGYINPDATTIDYIRGREFSPSHEHFDRAVQYWKSISSDKDADYDDIVSINANDIAPMITWGITPGQAIPVDHRIPTVSKLPESERKLAEKALSHMNFDEGESLLNKKIDVAFIGSCTNGRISDLREAAMRVKGKKVSEHVHAFVVPGSMEVARAAEAEGLHTIFTESGFEWRGAGCSICLGMNTDKLQGSELCASSSNRNFIGRQGSPKGRTLLMSPAMVAESALHGCVVDIRTLGN